MFFNIWAQKEAFIKACGLGLSYPTQQFNVPPMPGEKIQIIDKIHQQTWQMISFMPEISCSAALCYNTQMEDIHFLKLKNIAEINTLLDNDSSRA